MTRTRYEHPRSTRFVLTWLLMLALGLGACSPGANADGADDEGGTGTDDSQNTGGMGTTGGTGGTGGAANNDGSGGSYTTGGAGGTGGTGGASTACAPAQPIDPLTITQGANEHGYQGNVITWPDAAGEPRSALMVTNLQTDPAGRHGGYMRRYTYYANGTIRECVGQRTSHPGFGMVVNHYGNTAVGSHREQGSTFTLPLQGEHHAIQEYTWTYPIDGHNVDITVHWLFAAGRDHPVYAITYDLSSAPPNAVNADTRAPYGDIEWTGSTGTPNVDGVGWGDRYRFRSLHSPITLNSGWDYSELNTVPYVIEWQVSHDAEMGLVQTQNYLQHDAGGAGFFAAWGTTNPHGPMPPDWNWPFQLNQYELPATSASKRLAWGSNYGAVGQTAYDVYGNSGKASGYPYQSYSVYVALGTHSGETVQSQVTQVERALASTLSATVGSPRLAGPGGVGRTDPVTYEPAGYNHVYGTWELDAHNNAVDFELTAPNSLVNPVVVVHKWNAGAPCAIRLDDEDLCPGQDVYVTVDTASKTLWLTLASHLSGSNRVQILSSCP